MDLLKIIAGVFLFLIFRPVSAELAGLDDFPAFENVSSDKDAMNQLFRETVDPKPVDLEGFMHSWNRFKVSFNNKDWLVLVVMDNCRECGVQDVEAEWAFKYETARHRFVTDLNAELVFPAVAGTYNLLNSRHYIVSYPLISAITMMDMFRKHAGALWDPESIDEQHPLYRALYRYGEVMAQMNLDPQLAVKNLKVLQKEPPRLRVFNRGSVDVMFNADSETVFITDMVEYRRISDQAKTLRSEQFWMFQQWAKALLGWPCSRLYQCLPWTLDTFARGYADALPDFDRDAVINMLRQSYIDAYQVECMIAPNNGCAAANYIRNAWQMTPSADLNAFWSRLSRQFSKPSAYQ